MILRNRRHVLFAAALLTLGASGRVDTTPDAAAPETVSEPVPDSVSETADADSVDLAAELTGRSFLSRTVDGHQLVDGTTVRMSFDAPTIGASAGCNEIGGEFTVDGSTLIVGELLQTEKGCESALEAQDAWLSALLTSRPTVQLDRDELVVSSAEGTVRLVDRRVADPDRPLTETVWMVDALVTDGAIASLPSGAEPSLTITDGLATIRTGCNRGSARAEISDGSITFGPIALTRMACEPDRMDLETFVIGMLTGDVAFAIEADRLTLTVTHDDGTTTGLSLIA